MEMSATRRFVAQGREKCGLVWANRHESSRADIGTSIRRGVARIDFHAASFQGRANQTDEHRLRLQWAAGQFRMSLRGYEIGVAIRR